LRDRMQQGRLLPPIFRMLFVAMFIAAGLATPLCISPQSFAHAAQPVTTAATSESAKPEEAAKADPNDVYLHSPTVQAIARMIHLDVETTANIFQGINFAIIVLAVGYLLFRWLPKTLRNRTAKVRTDIESARKMTEDAYARLSAIEAKLSGLDGEIAQIRAQVEVESREDEKRIQSSIKEESARIVAAAEQEMEAAAAQAKRELRHFAADLAIEEAAKHLTITPETDRKLIAEFLGDSAVTATPKGGRK